MDTTQLMVTVLVASGLVQAIKIIWVGLLKRPKPEKLTLQVLSFVVSVGLAYFWQSPVTLPDASANPSAFAIALVVAAGEIMVFSHLVYVALLENLLKGIDALAFKSAKVIAP